MENNTKWIAHTSNHGVELLEDHLRLTAKLAKKYGDEFKCGSICEQIGLLHDIGKRTEKFKNVLKGNQFHIDHSITGAEILQHDGKNMVSDPFIRMMMCAIISGHHSNLWGSLNAIDQQQLYIVPDQIDFDMDDLVTENQKENALSSIEEYESILQYVKDNQFLNPLNLEDFKWISHLDNAEKMMLTRMIYSCLVDADYTATAAFSNQIPEQKIDSDSKILNTEELLKKLDESRNNIIKKADPNNKINQLRNIVFEDASKGGNLPTGFYTITAPTGTAKTLALMKFALEQAKKHNKKRIFVVLPYLSIISQNADVYKEIFGDHIVLEDDSDTKRIPGLNTSQKTTSPTDDEARSLSERWNAPIVVTTSVKFFETLATNHAVPARKLHNLSNSVIVFDECQTLKHDLTSISIRNLQILSQYFGSTILLSTATKPSYQYRKELESKYYATEVIKDVDSLYKRYDKAKKTKVITITEEMDYEQLSLLAENRMQMLFVLNTTKKALKLYQEISRKESEKNVYFLSSDLCRDHKKEVIESVQKKLKANETCILVSTQCVEAGVDIDFPVGAREYAPYPSIVQTAGRINRNGKKDGKLYVFKHKDSGRYDYPDTSYYTEAQESIYLSSKHNGLDLNDLSIMEEYYKAIYSGDAMNGKDKKEIRQSVCNLDMPGMEENYKLIDNKNQYTVIVPYNKHKNAFDDLSTVLEKRDYCIKKREMNMCSQFCVSRYGNREFIKSYCNQLYIRVKGNKIPINWYIADMENIYDEVTGLWKENDNDTLFF